MLKIYRLKMFAFALLTAMAFFATPSFAQSKTEIINTSYFITFGRYPNRDEFRYWNGQQVSSIARMVDNHRSYLNSNTTEKELTIRRSYQDAFGWDAKPDEVKYWLTQNKTYVELVNNHLSNWLANNPSSRDAVIKQSYYKVFNRLPNDAELRYWKSQPIYSYVQLVAFHTTWKMQNQKTSTAAKIQPNIQSNGISTSGLSPQAAAAVVAAGGANVVAAGGGNVVAAGGANVVSAGGLN